MIAWSDDEGDATLVIQRATKTFGGAVALEDCSLTVRRREILALLGPSGCGKSTLLNVIAGFEELDAGHVLLEGRTLDGVPPERRGVGMVFQHYALFPHMTVRANIAYGPRVRGVDAREARERVDHALALLKLEQFGARYPHQLSGGQRQRVAVARALAIRPSLLLLDEAFSALDRSLREAMQIELSLLLRQLDMTTIIVTHDQGEAFALADRIAVMEAGRILQVGTPEEIYRSPQAPFVFEFIGTANRFEMTVHPGHDGTPKATSADGLAFPLDRNAGLGDGRSIRAYLRAEDIRLSSSPTAVHRERPGKVALSTFLGARKRYVVALESGQQVVCELPSADEGLPTGADAFLDPLPGSWQFVGD